MAGALCIGGLLALEPGIFGDKYYALTGILLLAIIVGANCAGTVYIFHRKCGCLETGGICCRLCHVVFAIEWMPSGPAGIVLVKTAR